MRNACLHTPDSTKAHSASVCQWRPLMPPTSSLMRLADIECEPGKFFVLLYLKLPPENFRCGSSDQC